MDDELEWCVIVDDGSTEHAPGLLSYDEGNLAAPGLLYPTGGGAPVANQLSFLVNYRHPVFLKGELLLLSKGTGREVTGGKGRKPDKWSVQQETFPLGAYEQAIARAREVAEA